MIKTDNAIFYEPLFFEDNIEWTGIKQVPILSFNYINAYRNVTDITDERAVTAQSIHYGCFDVETTQQYLTVEALAHDAYMTGMKCVDICRDMGFKYAAVHVCQY